MSRGPSEGCGLLKSEQAEEPLEGHFSSQGVIGVDIPSQPEMAEKGKKITTFSVKVTERIDQVTKKREVLIERLAIFVQLYIKLELVSSTACRPSLSLSTFQFSVPR